MRAPGLGELEALVDVKGLNCLLFEEVILPAGRAEKDLVEPPVSGVNPKIRTVWDGDGDFPVDVGD
jgi:hypothetical protein